MKTQNQMKRVQGAVNHHLFKRGDKFWVRYEKAGKSPLAQSLWTENITDARIARDNIMAKYLNKNFSSQGALLVADKFETWMSIVEASSRVSTMVSIRSQWNNHLKGYFGRMNLDEINEEAWSKYVTWKRSQSVVRYGKEISLEKRKFFNDRKYLKMFLNWCHREGSIDKIPRLAEVDKKTSIGKVYAPEEISALFLNADLNLHLQISMAVTMGMRSSEIMFLEWSQIDFRAETIHLPAIKTKINQDRTFGISPDCLGVLKNRFERSNSPWVFPSPNNPMKSRHKNGNKSAWKTCKKLANVTGRFHDFRHTFLTEAFKTSTNPALICNYAGLSLEEAQKTYLHFTPTDTKHVSGIVRFL